MLDFLFSSFSNLHLVFLLIMGFGLCDVCIVLFLYNGKIIPIRYQLIGLVFYHVFRFVLYHTIDILYFIQSDNPFVPYII